MSSRSQVLLRTTEYLPDTVAQGHPYPSRKNWSSLSKNSGKPKFPSYEYLALRKLGRLDHLIGASELHSLVVFNTTFLNLLSCGNIKLYHIALEGCIRTGVRDASRLPGASTVEHIYSKISGPVRSNLDEFTQEHSGAVETISSGEATTGTVKGSRSNSKNRVAMPNGQSTWRELSGVPTPRQPARTIYSTRFSPCSPILRQNRRDVIELRVVLIDIVYTRRPKAKLLVQRVIQPAELGMKIACAASVSLRHLEISAKS